MNYYVSIGDSYEHSWQISILINSFKNLNLQDRLFVSISTENNFENKLSIDNVYFFSNKGKFKEYLKYNKWYCLYELLNRKIIEPPLTVIEPHTLLIKDTKNLEGDIVYNINNEFTFSEDYVFSKEQYKNVEENWIRISDNIIFNNVETEFFLDVLYNMELYCMLLKDNKNLDKFSLLNSIWKNNIESVFGINNLESYLPQNNLNYILDYRHGFKDKFHKSFFKKDIKLSGDNIKDLIGKNRNSKCLDFFYNTI